MLKQILPNSAKLSLVTEAPNAYYSGMLPGAISKLYTDDQIQVQLKPLAAWCNADYVEQRVQSIKASESKIYFEDKKSMDYDLLCVNVGSRTRGANETSGVWEHSLTTRPINDLLGKIVKKEQWFINNKVTPQIVVCGAGAAGIEMAFGFQRRWTDLFKRDIHVSIVSGSSVVLNGAQESLQKEIMRKFEEKNIKVYFNGQVKEIHADGIVLKDGR